MDDVHADILIVEDDIEHSALIQHHLRAYGYAHIRTASSLQEYAREIARHSPDLALMDLRLPDGSALESLAGMDKPPLFPVIIMTSHGDTKGAVRALKSGALDYVIKSPDAFADMPHIVARGLREWRLLQARQQSENSIVRQRDLLDALFEYMPMGLIVVDKDDRILHINRAFTELTGYTLAEIATAEQWCRLAYPDPAYRQYVQSDWYASIGQTGVSREFSVCCRDGTYKDIENHAVFLADGRALVTMYDITDRKQAEERVRKSEESLRTLFENIPGVVFRCESNAPWRMFHISEGVRALTGWRAPDFLEGRVSWESVVFPEDLPALRAIVQRAVDEHALRREYAIEYRIMHRDGNIRWVHVKGICAAAADGQSIHLVGVIVDITDRKHSEQEKQLHEMRLQSVVKILQYTSDSVQSFLDYALNEAITLTGSKVGYIYFYDEDLQVFELNSWSADVMKECRVLENQTLCTLDKTGVWGDAVRNRAPVILNDFSVHTSQRKGYPDGHVALIRFLTVPIFSKDRIVAVVGVANRESDYEQADVLQLTLLMDSVWKTVERMQAEQAVRESEDQLQLTMEAVSDGFWDWDVLAGKGWWNPRCYAMLGYEANEFSVCLESWMRLLHPDDHTRLWNEMLTQMRQPNAKLHVEYRIAKKSGEWIWWLTRGRVVEWDAQRLPSRMMGTHTDITQQKRAEEDRLDMERRLLHSQKLESLGVLAGGIAHDFNNLLMAVLGNLDIAATDTPPDSPVQDHIRNAMAATRRATELTRQMLAYSGKGQFIIKPINISELAEENAHLLRASIPRTVRFDFHLDRTVPPILGDPGQVQQVVMNLITNAAEAIGESDGVVSLTTGVQDCDDAYLQQCRDDEHHLPGAYVFVEVADTGCGMDQEASRRLFEPFFTTKFTGRGLGMSAVMGIVRGHHGGIVVESEVGAGTRIRVLFPVNPVHPSRPDSLPKSSTPDSPAAKQAMSGLVLLVDDEKMVRDLCQTMLHRLGFNTITAADGEEALECFKRHAGEIACIVLDLTMPRLDGAATFERIQQIQPGAKVILCSGYTQQEAMKLFPCSGLAGFIQKPYRIQNLRDALERILK